MTNDRDTKARDGITITCKRTGLPSRIYILEFLGAQFIGNK
jgi:hypothetical protein